MTPGLQRHVLSMCLSAEDCRELAFVARSCAVVGYREAVSSVTLQDLLVSGNWPLLVPLLRAREALRTAAEDTLGEPNAFFFEFTGLVTWREGASIGWHYDANRDYLASRHVTLVCYLNDPGPETGGFSGGDFLFRDGPAGEPERIRPRQGTCLCYASGPENVHSVEPITAGSRHTLAIWLTRDADADADAGLISRWLPPLEAAAIAGAHRPMPMFHHPGAYAIPGGEDLRLRECAALGLPESVAIAIGRDPGAPDSSDPVEDFASAAEALQAAAYWVSLGHETISDSSPGAVRAAWTDYIDSRWADLLRAVKGWRSAGAAYA